MQKIKTCCLLYSDVYIYIYINEIFKLAIFSFVFHLKMYPLICTVSLLLIFLVLLYKHVTRNFDYWSKRNVPFIKPVPFLGNFYEVCTLKKVMGEFIANLYHQANGPFFGIFLFDRPCLIVKSPELIKSILVKDFDYFKDRTILINAKADPLAAHFLFSIKNPEWKFIRTKLTPVFTSGKLKGKLLPSLVLRSIFISSARISLSYLESLEGTKTNDQ